jgi:hypothetical protein
MKRTPLTTVVHARATIGEMNRAEAPSGAQIPSVAHVVGLGGGGDRLQRSASVLPRRMNDVMLRR